MDFKNPRVLKSTKILKVRSLSYLENGLFENMGITEWFYMPYFKPTIDFNMLQSVICKSLNHCRSPNPLQVS